MQQVGELLPVGSIVLLKGGTKNNDYGCASD